MEWVKIKKWTMQFLFTCVGRYRIVHYNSLSRKLSEARSISGSLVSKILTRTLQTLFKINLTHHSLNQNIHRKIKALFNEQSFSLRFYCQALQTFFPFLHPGKFVQTIHSGKILYCRVRGH